MDTKEPQQYRLKPGIDLRITDLKDGLSFVHYQDDYVQWETEHVNALFETVDIDAIRKQLEEIVESVETELNYLTRDSLEILIDRVFSLMTGETLGGSYNEQIQTIKSST